MRNYKVNGVHVCFFFQAEDGIRDYKVTGVQTCALPISPSSPTALTEIHNASHNVVVAVPAGTTVHDKATVSGAFGTPTGTVTFTFFTASSKIGRASCRGRG